MSVIRWLRSHAILSQIITLVMIMAYFMWSHPKNHFSGFISVELDDIRSFLIMKIFLFFLISALYIAAAVNLTIRAQAYSERYAADPNWREFVRRHWRGNYGSGFALSDNDFGKGGVAAAAFLLMIYLGYWGLYSPLVGVREIGPIPDIITVSDLSEDMEEEPAVFSCNSLYIPSSNKICAYSNSSKENNKIVIYAFGSDIKKAKAVEAMVTNNSQEDLIMIEYYPNTRIIKDIYLKGSKIQI